LKRVRSFASATTLKLVYNALVQPHFSYCCSIWDKCNKTYGYAEKLQKLQNRSARVLTFSTYDTNDDLFFENLNWKTLSFQRKVQKSVMVYKSINGLAPDYMYSMFTDRDSVTSIQLRDTENKLAVPLPHTNYLKNSLIIVVLWHSLPIGLRQAQSLDNCRAGCISLITRSY
jgi:hypothetical protein